jgi:hypothetical protein
MVQQNKWDSKHLKDMERYARQIDAIYQSAVREAAAIGATIREIGPKKPFSFSDYPITKARIEKLEKSLVEHVQAIVMNGIDAQWTLANNKNSELANVVFGPNVHKLPKSQYSRYFSTNDKAREAFIARR